VGDYGLLVGEQLRAVVERTSFDTLLTAAARSTPERGANPADWDGSRCAVGARFDAALRFTSTRAASAADKRRNSSALPIFQPRAARFLRLVFLIVAA